MTTTVDALPSSAEKTIIHLESEPGSDEGDICVEVLCPAVLLPTLTQPAIQADGGIKGKRHHLLTPDISHYTQ